MMRKKVCSDILPHFVHCLTRNLTFRSSRNTTSANHLAFSTKPPLHGLPLDRLPGPEVWVVIRRKVSGEASEPEWKFYLSNAPIETPLSTFVRVSGMRWP